MKPFVSVFMPSYNKGLYTLDGISSVLGQTRPELELWVLENSTDGVTRGILKDSGLLEDPRVRYEEINDVPRGRVNVMGWLLNLYYPEARDYVFYISDDDVLTPDAFERLAGHLDTYPDHGACWGNLLGIAAENPGETGPDQGVMYSSVIYANRVAGAGSVDCHVDGGQIMHRASCLAPAGPVTQPYFEESPVLSIARHIDGIFMERLVHWYPLHPVPHHVVTHRMTNLSTYTPLRPA